MILGEPDQSGRRKPISQDGSSANAADLVIKSLGFDPEDIQIWS